MNLLGNAFKFTPEKGQIVVSLEEEKDFLRVEVRDNGIGIAKKNQKIIFDRFSQVQNYLQKKETGTGLGLSIVKNMIQKLGGHGSNFIFTIPLKFIPPAEKNK